MDNTDKQTITATASPRPWRVVAYDDSQCDIYDANGTPVCTMGHFSEDPQSVATLIVEAVNERVNLLNVLSEEQEHGYLMEEECDRLRDIVSRLYKSMQDAADVIRADTEHIGPFAPDVILRGVDIAELLREARAAVEDGK